VVVVDNTYDGFDRVSSQENGTGGVTTFTYETGSSGYSTLAAPACR